MYVIKSPLVSRRGQRLLGRRLRYAAVVAVLLAYLLPIAWVLTMSLKTSVEAFAYPPVFLFRPTLENYAAALDRSNLVAMIGNSLVAALGNTALSLAVGSLAAWGISRHRIGGRWLLVGILGIRMIPVITIVIPLFLLFVQLRLVDTRVTLIFAYLIINLPFVIWMMRAFIDDIPVEIEESAILDGCSTTSLIWRIVLPLALPGLIATGIFCFIFAWNELVLAIVLTRVVARTAMVGLTAFMTEQTINWGALSAAATLVMLPPILLAIALRRYLIRGLTAGALK